MTRYGKPASALAMASLFVAALAWAQSPSRTSPFGNVRGEGEVPGPAASELLGKISSINHLEMELGELARAKGQSEEVKRYGLILERDHRMADRRVAATAEKLNVPIHKPKDMDPDDAAVLQRLRAASGPDFDREFLSAMHEGHQKAIGVLETGRQTEVTALRELVGKLIPVLHQHDQLSQNLQGRSGGSHG